MKSMMKKLMVITMVLGMAANAFAAAKKAPPKQTNSTTAQIIFQGTFPQPNVVEKEPKLIYSANFGIEITVKPKRFSISISSI